MNNKSDFSLDIFIFIFIQDIVFILINSWYLDQEENDLLDTSTDCIFSYLHQVIRDSQTDDTTRAGWPGDEV